MCKQTKNMKTTSFIISLFLSLSAISQVRVVGSVKDNKGRILAGASITLKGTYDGTTTDSTGRFSFKTFEKGNFILSANNVGYKIAETPITLGKDTVTVDFSLKEEISELKAVVITAGAYEASDKKKGTVLKAH